MRTADLRKIGISMSAEAAAPTLPAFGGNIDWSTYNSGASTSEVQTITPTGTPTGGTFTVTYQGQTTGNIAYDASAATVELAVEALSTVGSGNCTISGSAGGPWTATFSGTLANRPVDLIEAHSAGNLLTGGTTPRIVIAQSVAGAGPAYFLIGSTEDGDDADLGTDVFEATEIFEALDRRAPLQQTRDGRKVMANGLESASFVSHSVDADVLELDSCATKASNVVSIGKTATHRTVVVEWTGKGIDYYPSVFVKARRISGGIAELCTVKFELDFFGTTSIPEAGRFYEFNG